MIDCDFFNLHTTNIDIKYDHSYLITCPGILKIMQFVFNAISCICIDQIHDVLSTGIFFKCVSFTGLCVTGLLLVLYQFYITKKYFMIPWIKIEFIFCVIWMLLYLISATCCSTFNFLDAYVFAAFFGYCAMVAYGCDAFLKYKHVKINWMKKKAQAAQVFNNCD